MNNTKNKEKKKKRRRRHEATGRKRRRKKKRGYVDDFVAATILIRYRYGTPRAVVSRRTRLLWSAGDMIRWYSMILLYNGENRERRKVKKKKRKKNVNHHVH